ncbi:MAG: 3'-5' exonuclease [Candidatus Berkiella sp.]
MSIFVFDIETIPDIIAGRKLFNLQDSSVSDAEVAELMFRKATEETGQSFVRTPLHQIVAISAVYRTHDQLKIWSLGSPDASEKELVQRFFDGIEKYTPQLVSWNGQAFDLPVLQYRALLNQVVAKRYWDTGELDSSYKWNNYISRYHQRHLDLMDVLASYQPRAYSRLDDIATLLGFPGKMGMDGSKVWYNYQQGKIEEIRNYCETDVINTYLVYLRFQQMRGYLSEDNLEQELSLLKDYLRSENKPHLTAFLQEWEQA